MTDLDARVDRVLAGIAARIDQPRVDDPHEREPDPPAWSEAEGDRAADRYEREVDARWER